jgi:hypothetical protein
MQAQANIQQIKFSFLLLKSTLYYEKIKNYADRYWRFSCSGWSFGL